MLVLMDMEWIENKIHYFCPTQISAMRVDNRWNLVDRFDALIKPFDSSCRQWKHIAYSGASPEDFLAASAGPLVFLNLFKWFYKDDVLCWWGEQPALVFQNAVGNLLHREVDHPMRVIYPAWKMNTTDNMLKIGSPYRLAKARGISVPAVEHSSSNDVETIRALLCGTFTSPDAIQSSRINPAAKVMTQSEFQKARQSKRICIADPSRHKLLYDTKNKLLHTVGCPDIGSIDDMKGFDTYKSCIQQGLKPCRCCKETYWQENWRLIQERLTKLQFNYVYANKGKLFHRPSCIHVKRIPFMELRGKIYYENCTASGLKPCGWCKPTIKQEIIPPHISSPKFSLNTHSFSRKTPHNSGTAWLKARKLTHYEKNALRRHEVAQKEREAFLNDKQAKTKAELRDEYTLTRSGYVFWAAVGYQTFHLRSCKKLEHISGLRGYARYNDAIRAGLTPCRLCKPSAKHDIKASVPIYHRERQGESVSTLDKLCDAQGYKHSFTAPDYYIETLVGKWRLDTRTHPVDVYHINLVTSPETTFYHKQPRLFLSLTDTFEYIRRHEISLMEKVRRKEKSLNESDCQSASIDTKNSEEVTE